MAMRWIPTSALQAFKARADEVAHAWAVAWGVTDLETTAECIPSTFDAGSLRGVEWRAVHAETGPWLQCTGDLAGKIAEAIFAHAQAPSALAAEVGQRAADALKLALEQFVVTAKPAVPTVVLDRRLSGHWGVRFVCRIGKAQWDLTMSTASMEALGCLQRPAAKPLSPRALESALARVPVAIRVELGHAELTLHDLTMLAVGDVVLAADPMSTPLKAVTEDGHAALAGQLGRTDSRRALQLTTLQSR